jgi:hypothetical protein
LANWIARLTLSTLSWRVRLKSNPRPQLHRSRRERKPRQTDYPIDVRREAL